MQRKASVEHLFDAFSVSSTQLLVNFKLSVDFYGFLLTLIFFLVLIHKGCTTKHGWVSFTNSVTSWFVLVVLHFILGYQKNVV